MGFSSASPIERVKSVFLAFVFSINFREEVHFFIFFFTGFGRGSGKGIIRSGVSIHWGIDSNRACSLVPGPSTRSMRGEDSSRTVTFCRERIRSTSSVGFDPSPRYRKMNRFIHSTYSGRPFPSYFGPKPNDFAA